MLIKYNNSLLYYNYIFFDRPTFFTLNVNGDHLRYYQRLIYICNDRNFYVYFYINNILLWINIRIDTNVKFNPKLQYFITCGIYNKINYFIFNKKSDGDLFKLLSKIKFPTP